MSNEETRQVTLNLTWDEYYILRLALIEFGEDSLYRAHWLVENRGSCMADSAPSGYRLDSKLAFALADTVKHSFKGDQNGG